MSTPTGTTTFVGPSTSALERHLRTTLVASLLAPGVFSDAAAAGLDSDARRAVGALHSTLGPDHDLLGIDVDRLRDLLRLDREEGPAPGEAAAGWASATVHTAHATDGRDCEPGAPERPETAGVVGGAGESVAASQRENRDGPDARTGAADLYEQLRELEAESARIELRRAEVLGRLIAAQTAADLADEPDAGPSRRREVAAQARSAVVDSAVASCGGRRGPWLGRAGLAQAAPTVAEPLTASVAAGELTFEQACTVVEEVDALEVPTDVRAVIAAAVAAYAARRRARTGAPAGQREFRACLRRQTIRHASSRTRRSAATNRRAVWIRTEDDGAASLGIRGADARCAGAYRRIDAIARALRGSGDRRTLDQLRSDIALDLLLFGRPAPDAPTSTDHPDHPAAGWPTAVVDVVISAAALLGATDEPGLVEGIPVAAETIRALAHGRDARWRRIVTDPATGYAMNAAVNTYRAPADMARVVRARDGRCRAPGCDRPAHTTDLDHVNERRHGGDTSAANLQSLCRRHHSKKTRHHWTATLTPDGTVAWRLPDGHTYTTFPYDYTDIGVDTPVEPSTPEPGQDGGSGPRPGQARGAEPGSEGGRSQAGPRSGSGSGGGRSETGPWSGPEATHDVAPAARPGARVMPATTDASVTGEPSDPLEAWLHGREGRLRDEISDLRAALSAERTAHAGTRQALEDYRGANPPF
ncbi:HNH endonuclease signature motif containing protein [Agilicoccus flavus]|uniref:HNH endonuclease signature motif containing protein n=1 Tax=Agilicoccus flavus TaxID=2775968 RepID=UPI001CF68DC6|nr:HNH endonuclease signature motif containing protein [Agilicoccus flavus]